MALDVVTSVVVAISVALLSVDVMFKDIVVAVELLNPVVVLATRSGKAKEVERGTRRRENITIASDSLFGCCF